MVKEHFQLDREKLKEVIWLIADHCPPEELGNVKLHKTLYFSDMMRFLSEGVPITGVDYLKQKFGPVARHLTAALGELEREGRVRTFETNYHGFFKKNYVSQSPYQATRLSDNEVSLVLEVLEWVRGKSAKEISEISHNAAWEGAELGERIPYFTALRLVPTEIDDSDREWARSVALQHATERPF